MKEILFSIINGQRKQALRQLDEGGFTMTQLFQAIADDEGFQPSEILTMLKVAESVGYVCYRSEAVRSF